MFEFDIFFIVFFSFVCAVILFMFIRGFLQWKKNNHFPRLSVDATVATKRMKVTHHHHHTGTSVHVASRVAYYATFQVESGDKMELLLTASEYNELTEGDFGKLSFQGTRYLGFKNRKVNAKDDTDILTEVVIDEDADVTTDEIADVSSDATSDENTDVSSDVTSDENTDVSSDATSEENTDMATDEIADASTGVNTDENS